MSMSGYFGTRRYLNPPSAPPHRPQFSQPPQLGRTPYWDRYVTVMPALFKCKQSKAPAHTILHTTTLLGREAFGTSSTLPPPLLFSFAIVDESIPMFDPAPADGQNISLHDFHLSAFSFLWFWVTCRRFHRSPPSCPLSSTNNYFQQLRRESAQETRVKCSVKTRSG